MTMVEKDISFLIYIAKCLYKLNVRDSAIPLKNKTSGTSGGLLWLSVEKSFEPTQSVLKILTILRFHFCKIFKFSAHEKIG